MIGMVMSTDAGKGDWIAVNSAGAAVRVRPADAALYARARQDARFYADTYLRAQDALTAEGLPQKPLTGDERAGLFEYFLSVELCIQCVTAWRGIGDERGRKAARTPGAFMALCKDPEIARIITTAACAKLEQEKCYG
jgi:hypothetical protein